MRGSLRQRSAGSFELRVYIGADPTTGRRRYRSMTVRGNRGEAERELAAMVATVRSVRAVGVRSSMSELLEAWFSVASGGWTPTTTRQTRSVLYRYLHPHFGELAVGEVTPATIDAVYASLRREGGIGGQPLAPGTLARAHTVLRAALSQAMRWGWIWDNPAERAHRIVSAAPELRPPTPAELRALLDHIAARDDQLHLFVVLPTPPTSPTSPEPDIDSPCSPRPHSPRSPAGDHSTSAASQPRRPPLIWEDCLEISAQFDAALEFAQHWPTRGEAEAAGWNAQVNYAMGMGTHHALGNPLQGSFDPERPDFLQYDGNGPEAKLVGMSWYVDNGPDAPPDGFAGDNDWWHNHEYLCISNSTGLVIRDGPCLVGQNGTTVYLANYWMVHAWIVPGWQFQTDVFRRHHPCLLASGPAAPDDPCWDL